MFCKKCGAQLDDDAQFCEKCGTAIKRTVPVAAAQDEDVEESDSVITDDKEPEAKITTAVNRQQRYLKITAAVNR